MLLHVYCVTLTEMNLTKLWLISLPKHSSPVWTCTALQTVSREFTVTQLNNVVGKISQKYGERSETNQHQLSLMFFMCRSTYLHTLDKITPQWVCPNLDMFTYSGLSQASDRFERQLFATNCAAYCWGLSELALFKWSANGCSSAGWPWIRYFLLQGSLSPLPLALKIDQKLQTLQLCRLLLWTECLETMSKWIAHGCSAAAWPWMLGFSSRLTQPWLRTQTKNGPKLQTLELCHIFLRAECFETMFKWTPMDALQLGDLGFWIFFSKAHSALCIWHSDGKSA